MYDFIIREQYDAVTGETYEAMTACNNSDMAARCRVKSANKVVWCVKANADFNSVSATSLRAGIMNGSINLLCTEFDAEDVIKKLPGYDRLSANEKSELLLPYVQTTLAINEMINLEYEVNNSKVKIKERSGMRKDRFSSIQYNNAIVNELNTLLKPKDAETDILNLLRIRPAKRVRSF